MNNSYLNSFVSLERNTRIGFNVEKSSMIIMIRVKTINCLGKFWVCIVEMWTSSICWSTLTTLTVDQTQFTWMTLTCVPLILTWNQEYDSWVNNMTCNWSSFNLKKGISSQFLKLTLIQFNLVSPLHKSQPRKLEILIKIQNSITTNWSNQGILK